jgi:hypothetical protein
MMKTLKVIITLVIAGLGLISCVSKSILVQPEVLSCQMHMNLCYVQASFNDSRLLDMVLDTGSSFSVLNTSVNALPHLHKVSEGNVAGPGATKDSTYILFDQVTIGLDHIRLPDQSIVSIPFDYVSERTGTRTDGAIGSNLFQRYVVKINYTAGTVEIFEPLNFVADPTYQSLPLQFEGNVPVVNVELRNQNGQTVSGRFLVDTGQILAGLIISKTFERLHSHFFNANQKHAVETVSAVGGKVKFRRGHIPSVSAGGVQFGPAEAAFLISEAGVYSKKEIAGGIGPDLLKQFDVILDYSRKIVLLKPHHL